MIHDKICGVGAAMITPFKADGSIDKEALCRMLDYTIEGGTDYIVALGTTAETPTLTADDKREIVTLIRQHVAGRVPIVVGMGGNNTAELCRQLREMDTEGVVAVLSVTPYYNKPSQEGLYQHYKAVAEASPLPVILYNVPGRTGVNLTAETTCRLSHDCPNIVAVKEASGNIEQIEQIIKHKREGFIVLSGDDGITIDVIRKGGNGVISVAVDAFPAKFCNIVDLAMEGKFDQADEAYKELDEAVGALFEQGNPVGVKAALACKGIIGNHLRLPLVPATDSLMSKMENLIERYDLR